MQKPQNPRPSFHRRILPWIYIVTFLAVAPAVVFYTAGYRWNVKKGKVERFSTVIIDATPAGAQISIDGSTTTYVTPSTIQTMTPGEHRFAVSLPGYRSWEKKLNMESERVTFANTIWLWKIADPSLRSDEPVSRISVSPDGTSVIRFLSATPTRALLSDALGAGEFPVDFQKPIVQPAHCFWSSDSRYLLVESAATSWLVDVRKGQKPLEITKGTYRWSGSAVLIGTDGSRMTTISLPQTSITRLPLATSTVDILGGDEIRKTNGSSDRILVTRSRKDRGLVLPAGNWNFWTSVGSIYLLRDTNSWLSLDALADQPEYHAAFGDLPRAIPNNGSTPVLFMNEGELWTWDLVSDPVLIYRQSEPIIQAAWHRDGHDVFFATKINVFALNLDQRDGRIQTKLASFDHISDLAVVGKELLVAAKQDDVNGVWSLKIE